MGADRPRRSLELQARLRTDLRTVPGVLQSLGMLTMTQLEVVEATERSLSENPVLERAGGHPCPGCGRHVSSGYCHRCRERQPGRDSTDNGAGWENGSDPFRALETEARMEVRTDCRHALSIVAAHLTNRGLLDMDSSEIAELHGLAPDQVQEALRALRAAGPPGIGAGSVMELLVEQAEALVRDRQAPSWLPDMVRRGLEDLADDNPESTAQALGLSEDEVRTGWSLISSRLRPFAVVETAAADTPVPGADVFLYRGPGGSFDVEVPDSTWFGLRVVDLAAGFGETGEAREAREWLAAHELAARQLIRQVDGRANVLLRVTLCAASRQQGFIEHGPAFHRSLTRTEVAAELGVHPSTVSRAVRGKRLRLPQGRVVDLACLFGKGVAARSTLQALIASAGKRKSDAELCTELAEYGFHIARRTVVKYRHALPLDGSFRPG